MYTEPDPGGILWSWRLTDKGWEQGAENGEEEGMTGYDLCWELS